MHWIVMLTWIAAVGAGVGIGMWLGGSLPSNRLVAYLREQLAYSRETIRQYKELVDVLQMRDLQRDSWPEAAATVLMQEINKTGCAHCLPPKRDEDQGINTGQELP